MKTLESLLKHMTYQKIFLPFFLFCTLISYAVQAVSEDLVGSTTTLSMQDYFIIFVIGILYLNLFIVGIQRIFKRRQPEKHESIFFTGFGTLLAFLFIAAGSLFIFSSILALVAITARIATFEWLITMILYYTHSLIIGILSFGTIGLVLLLFGIYLVILICGNPLFNGKGTPKRLGYQSKMERNDKGELEPLNPTITFKVFNWDRDDPVIDAKVVLKQMNGTRLYSKFTNFSGEVTFDKIEGYGSEYYAYIAGDEKREKYRVLRKKTPDETVV